MDIPFHLFVYDVETTGLNKSKDEIIQISWMLLKPGLKVMLKETAFFQPSVPVSREAKEVHGISNAKLLGEPPFKDYAERLYSIFNSQYTSPLVICGFNSYEFDNRILSRQMAEAGYEINLEEFPNLDVGRLFKKLNPRTLEACSKQYLSESILSGIREHLLKSISERTVQRGEGEEDYLHDADYDMYLTAAIIRSMFNNHPEIPTDPALINAYIFARKDNAIDLEGKLVWIDGEAAVDFGKHAGTKLRDLAEDSKGRSFLGWMLNNDFSNQVKTYCRDALDGVFYYEPK